MQYVGSHREPRPAYLRLPVLAAAAGVFVTVIAGIVAVNVIGRAPDRGAGVAAAARPDLLMTTDPTLDTIADSPSSSVTTVRTTPTAGTVPVRAGADRAGGRAPTSTTTSPPSRGTTTPARRTTSTTTSPRPTTSATSRTTTKPGTTPPKPTTTTPTTTTMPPPPTTTTTTPTTPPPPAPASASNPPAVP